MELSPFPALRLYGAKLNAGLENVVLDPTDIRLDGIASEGIFGEGQPCIRSSPATIGTVEHAETLLV